MYKIRNKSKQRELRTVVIHSDFPFLPDLKARIERELGEKINLQIVNSNSNCQEFLDGSKT